MEWNAQKVTSEKETFNRALPRDSPRIDSGGKVVTLTVFFPFLSLKGADSNLVSSWIHDDLQLSDFQETSVGSHQNWVPHSWRRSGMSIKWPLDNSEAGNLGNASWVSRLKSRELIVCHLGYKQRYCNGMRDMRKVGMWILYEVMGTSIHESPKLEKKLPSGWSRQHSAQCELSSNTVWWW